MGREDRERRRKERAARREKAGNNKSSKSNPISIIFWSTINFFWSMIRPWTWPLFLSIPLLLICFVGIGYGAYSVYSEIGGSNRMRGRRVPKYNSWSYKLANMFTKKSLKQRVRDSYIIFFLQIDFIYQRVN